MLAAAWILALAFAPVETAAGREKMRVCLETDGDLGLKACKEALAAGLTPLHAALTQDAVSRKLIALERLEEAEAALVDLTRLRPKDSGTFLRLGELRFFGLGRAEDALGPIGESIRLKGDDPEARASLGAALSALGRVELALESFREALRIDPTFFETRPASRQILEAAEHGQAWPSPRPTSGDPKH